MCWKKESTRLVRIRTVGSAFSTWVRGAREENEKM